VSKWPGKTIIGLTGNIGTGKSVVRKMLEHLGAYGIDADTLSHRAMARGAPAYAPIVQMFGQFILSANGEIDRGRLGRIVFSDPDALTTLERIVHPLVEQAVDLIVRRAPQPVVVIEAIKLFESSLKNNCDSLWVVYSPPEIQLARLIKNRKMPEAEARQRITSQPPQEKKISQANIVIRNVGTFEETWSQVVLAWQKTIKTAIAEPTTLVTRVAAQRGELTILRGKPRHSAEIAGLINRLRKPNPPLTQEDVMGMFGEKAFLVLQSGETMLGVVGWQVENLIARTTDILIDPYLRLEDAIPPLIQEMEQASRVLQCEASLIFLTQEMAQNEPLWRSLGYERRTPPSLGVLAWQEAAQESMPPNTIMFFKQLRVDRVLRPI